MKTKISKIENEIKRIAGDPAQDAIIQQRWAHIAEVKAKLKPYTPITKDDYFARMKVNENNN